MNAFTLPVGVITFKPGTIPADRFVMTAWRYKEALWFVSVAAEHPTVGLAQTVIVHVAGHERKAKLLEHYRTANS